MKPRGLYIIGASGTGKSTLMLSVVEALGLAFGETEIMATRRVYQRGGTRTFVDKLYASRLWDSDGTERGAYLGIPRAEFPGTDALSRSIGPCVRNWLEAGEDVPELVLGEGTRLSTRPSMQTFAKETDLLVVNLTLPAEIQAERVSGREHEFTAEHYKRTATKSQNTVDQVRELGVPVAEFDTSEYPLESMVEYCALHLS